MISNVPFEFIYEGIKYLRYTDNPLSKKIARTISFKLRLKNYNARLRIYKRRWYIYIKFSEWRKAMNEKVSLMGKYFKNDTNETIDTDNVNEVNDDNSDNIGSEYGKELTKLMGKNYTKFIDDLQTNADDPKVLAAIKSGFLDGEINDDVVHIDNKIIEANKLKPIQSEVDINKSLFYPLTNIDTARNILKGKDVVIMAPIVTYRGKYVVDGHHRWSQIYAVNPKATLKTEDLDMKNAKPLTVIKAVQMSISTILKNVPAEHVEGTNLLKASEKKVKDFVISTIKDEVIPIYNEYGAGKTKEEIADYIWNNVKIMQEKSQSIKGAPERGYMPQTDKAVGWEKPLIEGEINWNKPR